MAVTKKAKNDKQTFRTKLLQAGKTATGIQIPHEVVERLGAGKKPQVYVTLNGGYTYRNTIAVMGGIYMVGVSAEHRKEANVEGGDEIEVTLKLDTDPREVEVPADMQKAINNDATAKQNFEALSYSKKQALVLPVKDAKTDDTRQKRIEKAVDLLKQSKA